MALDASPLSQLSIKRLDHLGLVAGMCQELNLAGMIDEVLPKTSDHRVSHGQAFVAMILNGLGFHSRTLHMFPGFFADKPIDRLIGADIKAEHLNDDLLGRCLDALYDVGVSALYQAMAEKVVDKLGLQSRAVHLDITSFHVDGEYVCDDGDDSQRIKLVKGYSRDHRPELNQVILELICENQAGIPVYMQALSGNTNDQKAFAATTRDHIKSLKAAQKSRYLVADAALYTTESLHNIHKKNQLFVSRVPMRLKAAQDAVNQLDPAKLQTLDAGYQGYWLDANYADVPQKWLVLRSEQAMKRQQHTLEKKIRQTSDNELKAFQKLCKKRFACEPDAMKALHTFEQGLQHLQIEEARCLALPVYQRKGRPRQGQKPDRYDYQLTGQPASNVANVAQMREQSGIFILATNDIDETPGMQELLTIYKSQQNVERGFRFLKSPEFLTASLFLKKPERIEALLMVMTCSLMIYAALEHRIRQALKEQNQHFPDMKNKPGQSPTARWVFLCFMGIHEACLERSPPLITDIQERHQVIINVLGSRYRQIYS